LIEFAYYVTILSMRSYELMVIYSSNLNESEVKKQITATKDRIKTHKGVVSSEEFWGLKDFAYEIKKLSKGYYALFTVELDPNVVNELSTWMIHQDKYIVSHMITKLN